MPDNEKVVVYDHSEEIYPPETLAYIFAAMDWEIAVKMEQTTLTKDEWFKERGL